MNETKDFDLNPHLQKKPSQRFLKSQPVSSDFDFHRTFQHDQKVTNSWPTDPSRTFCQDCFRSPKNEEFLVFLNVSMFSLLTIFEAGSSLEMLNHYFIQMLLPFPSQIYQLLRSKSNFRRLKAAWSVRVESRSPGAQWPIISLACLYLNECLKVRPLLARVRDLLSQSAAHFGGLWTSLFRRESNLDH